MASSKRPVRKKKEFNPTSLWSTVVAIPLQQYIERDGDAAPQEIVIDLNLDCRGGRVLAREKVLELLKELGIDAAALPKNNGVSEQYLFVTMPGADVRKLVQLDQTTPLPNSPLDLVLTDPAAHKPAEPTQPLKIRIDTKSVHGGQALNERAIYRVWPDFNVQVLINKTISTVKADAAHKSFSALGQGIVWAVMDSGIDTTHPHFDRHGNTRLSRPLGHRDFSLNQPMTPEESEKRACQDPSGHGTHVAGIIAGAAASVKGLMLAATTTYLDEAHAPQRTIESIDALTGIAPECKLVSLRVLDEHGKGNVSSLIAAINYVQEINGYGRRLLIHGVNMSLGYDFDPEWFACGQSPLCVEVDRLVRSGVVVVVAAGNSGFVFKQGVDSSVFAAGESLTINDPGNADLAITVGSTHRDMPHLYGVSYFSSKGPTGDGRLKPDILAPGEKILSCAAGEREPQDAAAKQFQMAAAKAGAKVDRIAWYAQDSGTSMAAPHVSGAIAAFLSIRREFIGRPDDVKRIFLASATDLKRERYFQGNGLVDLMRAIQSI